VARRRAHRRAVRPQLRRGRREQRAARRPDVETFLSELVTAQAYENRHMTMESMYEYGSRVGVWRILREFEQRGLPLTVFGVVIGTGALPRAAQAFMEPATRSPTTACAGSTTRTCPRPPSAAHVGAATHLLKELTGGAWPAGWYTGRDSPNTRRLVADQGGYEYDSDYYGDDLPFWLQVQRTDGSLAPHLVVPYSLDTNDMRFVQAQGFNTGEHFFTYLRDSFDALYAEGDPAGLDRPKMMSIGMHCRLLGRPGRIGSLRRFLDHVQAHERVWICRRIDIAHHWKATHPFDAATAFVWK
jgi:allantoinase